MLRGVKQAAALNTIATIAKIVPLLGFLVAAGVAFRADVFAANFAGAAAPELGGLAEPGPRHMLLTVFVFVGIEGASVYSRLARKRADVGVATVLGFLAVLALLVLVTMLSYGILPRAGAGGAADAVGGRRDGGHRRSVGRRHSSASA